MKLIKENFYNYISSYEEDELFYRELYYQEKLHPETFSAYLKTLDKDFIINHRIYVPALRSEPWYPLIDENLMFEDVAGDIKVIKHYRYSPIFEHQHEFFEVLCIYEGQADTTIQGIQHTLHNGDICIIPPNTKHSVGIFDNSIAINLLIRTSSFQSTFFQILTSNSALSHFFSHVLYKKTEGNYLIFHTKDDPIIHSSLEDLFIEYLGHQKYSPAFLNTMLMLFWAQLLRYHEHHMESFLTRDHNPVSITSIIDYLNANYQTITLSEAAKHFGFSQSYFSTLIKESTGQTFLQIIKGIKLNQACRALKETSLSIASICEIIGYENPEHFMRTFKKEFGLTPNAYRKASRNALS